MIRALFLAALALCISFGASAQRAAKLITLSQIATLKAACLADTVACKPLHDAANDEALAAYFNADTSTFIVWRTSVTKEELTANDAFAWDRVDNLSVGKARIWDAMFDNSSRSINPSKANVRAGIAAAWVGTAADLAVRAAVLAQCQRSATRAEKILATGTGTAATPALLTFEGAISVGEASLIRS